METDGKINKYTNRKLVKTSQVCCKRGVLIMGNSLSKNMGQ